MAEDLVENAGAVPADRVLGSWGSVVFAPVGDGQRRRRGSDAVRLGAAVVALGCCLLLIRFDSRMDRAITEVRPAARCDACYVWLCRNFTLRHSGRRP